MNWKKLCGWVAYWLYYVWEKYDKMSVTMSENTLSCHCYLCIWFHFKMNNILYSMTCWNRVSKMFLVINAHVIWYGQMTKVKFGYIFFQMQCKIFNKPVSILIFITSRFYFHILTFHRVYIKVVLFCELDKSLIAWLMMIQPRLYSL